ncbi:MAG: signal recognition particle-docking protein FtsY [Phormidesmis sp.]
MAAFNWFRRSYEEPQKPEPEAPAEAEKTEPEETEAAPDSSEDYLNWAKAAYQNIQARQTKEKGAADTDITGTEDIPGAEPPTQTPVDARPDNPLAEAVEETTGAAEAEEPAEDTAPLADAGPSESTFAEDTVSADLEADELAAPEEAPEEAPPTVDPTAAEPEAIAPPAPETPDTTTDSPTATGDLPFWAKAQAEREERLARLQAEAILEPQPEPELDTAQPEFEPLDIDLDEAFLWSAEVLASQGRRADQISLEEITWLNKLRQGLDKTRRGLVNQLKAIVGQGPLNDEAVDEIESLLLQADVGVAATDKIISALQTRLREETLPPEQAISYLKSLLRDMLDAPLQGEHNLTFTPEKETLSIWLMTGVNGAGKTTTIGKLAHIATKSGFSCLIGAADTFRAAAVEQVKVWGARSGVEVIANPGQNTDPAAVVFDAISAATARNTELLLIDTAGRLQNKKNLMDELAKVRRIIDKKAPDATVESLLVLDATLGQNGLRQAQVFAEAAQLSGVVLTKLDGTARGGVALAVVQQLGLPIRFIGAGEGIEDLRPFSSYEFVEALLNG